MNLKKASIDIGSNSILLLITEKTEDGFQVLENEANVTGLGRDLDENGAFIEIAMDESYIVLKSYIELCASHGIQSNEVIATATEASRVSNNSHTFFKKMKKDFGLEIVTITGDGEAFYSTKGILFDSNIKEHFITIMDIGGASTELIKVDTKTQNIHHSFSMPVGAVRMNNWIAEGCSEERLKTIFTNYSEDLAKVKGARLHCVAGTMTSVANIYLKNKQFIEEQVNRLEFSAKIVNEMESSFLTFTSDDFLAEFPFLGKRSLTIYSGITLANKVFEELGTSELYISTYGLRYGTILAGEIKEEYVWK
jgi:exopolyphosphatase/guanosine-5'-triphosphate,3'-diphosphate pyrophosphatase